MSISGISPQEAEKAFKVPILGGILRAAIGLIGFYHILKGDSTGFAIQMHSLTAKENSSKPVTGKTPR